MQRLDYGVFRKTRMHLNLVVTSLIAVLIKTTIALIPIQIFYLHHVNAKTEI